MSNYLPFGNVATAWHQPIGLRLRLYGMENTRKRFGESARIRTEIAELFATLRDEKRAKVRDNTDQSVRHSQSTVVTDSLGCTYTPPKPKGTSSASSSSYNQACHAYRERAKAPAQYTSLDEHVDSLDRNEFLDAYAADHSTPYSQGESSSSASVWRPKLPKSSLPLPRPAPVPGAIDIRLKVPGLDFKAKQTVIQKSMGSPPGNWNTVVTAPMNPPRRPVGSPPPYKPTPAARPQGAVPMPVETPDPAVGAEAWRSWRGPQPPPASKPRSSSWQPSSWQEPW